MRPLICLFVAVIALGVATGTAAAAERVDLRPVARALDATRCPATDPAAIARLPERCFVPFDAAPERLDDTLPNPPHTWYRLVVPGAVGDGRGWILHLSFMVADGELYDLTPGGAVRSATPIGMKIPVAIRPIHTYDDRVPLPASLRAADTLVVSVFSTRRSFEPFELVTGAALRDDDADDQRTYFAPLALLNGMLLSMALFNGLLFLQLRQPSYALYSLSMLAMVAFQTIQSGVAWTLVWPNAPVRDDYPAYLAYLVYFALVTAFTRSFLDLRRTSKTMDNLLLAALAVLALDAVLYVVFPGVVAVLHLWAFMDPVAVVLMVAALLAAGIVAWKRGVVSARYYVIGFAGAATGLLLEEAADYGLIALPVWKDLCSATGVAWEAVFLALALAERIRFAEREAARLTEYAYRDQLTGIPNRRAFDESLEREWRRGIRSARTLSLLIVDIDHFKAYNDRFGHQQGDVALRAVANEIARAARRPGDFAARYGGEEFALVLAETGHDGAFLAAEAVRAAIRQLALENENGPLTVSVGSATMVPGEGEFPERLIALADGALYAAKAAGRDRTVLAS